MNKRLERVKKTADRMISLCEKKAPAIIISECLKGLVSDVVEESGNRDEIVQYMAWTRRYQNLIPSTAEVRCALAATLRDARLLRRLLKLSRDADAMRERRELTETETFCRYKEIMRSLHEHFEASAENNGEHK